MTPTIYILYHREHAKIIADLHKELSRYYNVRLSYDPTPGQRHTLKADETKFDLLLTVLVDSFDDQIDQFLNDPNDPVRVKLEKLKNDNKLIIPVIATTQDAIKYETKLRLENFFKFNPVIVKFDRHYLREDILILTKSIKENLKKTYSSGFSDRLKRLDKEDWKWLIGIVVSILLAGGTGSIIVINNNCNQCIFNTYQNIPATTVTISTSTVTDLPTLSPTPMHTQTPFTASQQTPDPVSATPLLGDCSVYQKPCLPAREPTETPSR